MTIPTALQLPAVRSQVQCRQQSQTLESANTPSIDINDTLMNIPATPTIIPSSDDSNLYLNRELSWIYFNHRVLNEAQRPGTPLLERVKFLAIVSANIDEFYMKRLGGLKQQVGAGVTRLTVDGRTPKAQLDQCRALLFSMQKEKEQICRNVLKELRCHKIEICRYEELNQQDQALLQDYYWDKVFPLLTPFIVDKLHPFPFISNLSLNLLVALQHQDDEVVLQARVKIPVGGDVPRFVRVSAGNRFVLLEDLIIHFVDLLFPQTRIISCALFRVTRNAITDNDHTDVEDMLELIERELRDRRFAPVVRLQTSSSMDPLQRHKLVAHLGLLEDKDVFDSDILVRMSDLMEIALLEIPTLRDVRHHPVDNVYLRHSRSIFDAIRVAGSILLQHPYESFVSSVERFVCEASCDQHVASIKMTLYRTSADTHILQYLIDAARGGKQVTVVVELKARFDEAANIEWATQLEQAGVHVNYGVAGLKTHCKTILVVRRERGVLRRYAHIGTGNYHAGTSRVYSDLGLLTCDLDLTTDLAVLFNYLTTGCQSKRNYRCILTAPWAMKTALLQKIEREINHHSQNLTGLIRMKTNALEDPDVTAALYRASCAGVTVQLLVRDICRLRPGLPGISENIHVVSIVGRFLEHSRIYHFGNGGDDEYYIGSADLMTRNLERRVELIIPVTESSARQLLEALLEQLLSDNQCAWKATTEGHYVQRYPDNKQPIVNAQYAAITGAQRRLSDSAKLKKIPAKGIFNRAIARIF